MRAFIVVKREMMTNDLNFFAPPLNRSAFICLLILSFVGTSASADSHENCLNTVLTLVDGSCNPHLDGCETELVIPQRGSRRCAKSIVNPVLE